MHRADPISGLINRWRADPSVAAEIAAWREVPPCAPRTRPFPADLHPALVSALVQRGILSLYAHQAAAWDALRAGQSVIVATSTASGKTLCYNLPILDRLLREPQTRALFLFPTKALAQDQAAALSNWKIEGLGNTQSASLKPAIYDGDTPAHARPAIRRNARLLFTNPDMLHLGILPHHTDWAEFFRNLRYVVIDEAHSYRGVFGSHVANTLRRLQRVAQFYGVKPQFILTSATIANPQEHAARLVESGDPASIKLVDDDGAGHGPRHFLIYNPPVVDPQLGLRRSALQESVRLAEDLLAYGAQTIIFARSRRSVEIILSYLRQGGLTPGSSLPAWRERKDDAATGAIRKIRGTKEGKADSKDANAAIRGYRSGYLPEQRRQIEHGLRTGLVRAVVATNALELGIDIGDLQAALLVGYPGSIAAARQQAGRAGRGERPALAVLVAASDPLDQFLAAHPDYLFARDPEHALINPDNLLILLDHLRCAAFELPFQAGDRFGSVEPAQLAEMLDFLQAQGSLHRSGSKYFWMADQYPAQAVSLRSAAASPVVLQTAQDDPAAPSATSTIGIVDRASACWMVHPQAIYLHEGTTYQVETLDLEAGQARLRRVESEYYTLPRNETSVQLVEMAAEEAVCSATKARGEILVTTKVTGFQKVRWYSNETIGIEALEMPPGELLTSAYWLALDDMAVETLRQAGLWRNDPNDYGPKWNALRQIVRQRDGYRCQVCGAVEENRAHDVHHKTPFRLFASAEQANQLENLVTLCPNCHHRVETAVRVRSGLGGVAYTLSHLAPFFLMCDVGDLGVHSDPQSPLTAGRPTLVLYDQAPGGIGLSQRLFELHSEVFARAAELVQACGCTDGCPSCVGPGGENGLGGKREALAILHALTGKWVDR